MTDCMKQHNRTEAHWFDGAGGVRLAADVFGSDSDAPIVFLPGGGQRRSSWRRTAERIAQTGWHAITLDLRGHGDSEWPADGRYGYDQFTADMSVLRKHLARAPVLVGASLGGKIALATAGEGDDDATRALILVDTVPQTRQQGISRVGEVFQSSAEGFESPEAAAAFIANSRNQPVRPDAATALARNMRQDSDGRWRWHWDPRIFSPEHRLGTIPARSRLDAAASRLKIPVLLCYGEKSDVVDADGIAALKAKIPHMEVAMIAGAGHMLVGDQNDIFADALTSFLKRL